MNEAYHEFDYKDKHYRVVFDETYETREIAQIEADEGGSYAYGTEKETKKAEDEEIEKLRSGYWIVVGCIVTKKCEGCNVPGDGNQKPVTSPVHCAACSGTYEIDSLWGIVIENDTAKIEAYIREMM